eukprot:Rhum_TRINITY_DN10036_c0_g1::Rhum_TRINITY_DN10036_c0_g1_i1::g.36516::m.36516
MSVWKTPELRAEQVCSIVDALYVNSAEYRQADTERRARLLIAGLPVEDTPPEALTRETVQAMMDADQEAAAAATSNATVCGVDEKASDHDIVCGELDAAAADAAAAAPISDFFSPTAVEDIFAGLSDRGREVAAAAAASSAAAAAADVGGGASIREHTPAEHTDGSERGRSTDGSGEGEGERRDDGDVGSAGSDSERDPGTFAGVRLDMSPSDLRCLRAILRGRDAGRSSGEAAKADEALAYERWAAARAAGTQHIEFNRGFGDSDIEAYPRLVDKQGACGLPWEDSEAQGGKRAELSGGWTDACSMPPPPGDAAADRAASYVRDVETAYELQARLVQMEARAACVAGDFAARRRLCRHLAKVRSGGEGGASGDGRSSAQPRKHLEGEETARYLFQSPRERRVRGVV